MAFNDSQNNRLAHFNEALENVMQSFLDGLFVVFIDDQEILDLKQPITVDKSTNVTFIRMTFLTGTYW